MIHLIVFILTAPLVLIISILPFRLLYILSDIIFLIVYYVVGYRKKVVFNNIKIAFPEKSDSEIKAIGKASIKHFIDIMLEMVKTFTISEKSLSKRFKIINLEEFYAFAAKYDSLILISSHYGNYEWLVAQTIHLNGPAYAAFKKIKNPYLDRFVKKSRERFNCNFISTKEFMKLVEDNKRTGTAAHYGLLSDQSPKKKAANHYVTFFNKQVPVYMGAENIAKDLNIPLFTLKTKKVKRGYYETEFQIVEERPNEVPKYQIMSKFMHNLEAQIKEDPRYYFWTHKRFKYMK